MSNSVAPAVKETAGLTPQAQIAAIFAVCAAAAVFLSLPVILGQLAEIRGFSPSRIAAVASAETFGLAVTALFGPWLLARFSTRSLMAGGLSLLAILNLLSAWEWSFEAFVGLRIAASIAAGLVAPAAVAVIGAARVPERSISHAVSAQIVTSAVGLYSLGQISASFGIAGLYGALAAFTAAAGLLVAVTPMPGISLGDEAGAGDMPKPALSMIASVLFFFCALGVYWAFIERAGKEYDIAVDDVNQLLAISNVAALFGSLSAPWFTRKYGDRAVLLVGLSLSVITPFVFLWTAGGAMGYSTNLSLFVVLWNLLMVVQMAAISRFDPSGRAISLTPAAQGFGLSLGPLIVGQIAESSGFVAAVASSGLFALAGLLAAWLAYDGRSPQTLHSN